MVLLVSRNPDSQLTSADTLPAGAATTSFCGHLADLQTIVSNGNLNQNLDGLQLAAGAFDKDAGLYDDGGHSGLASKVRDLANLTRRLRAGASNAASAESADTRNLADQADKQLAALPKCP